jgi:hypothetical protein
MCGSGSATLSESNVKYAQVLRSRSSKEPHDFGEGGVEAVRRSGSGSDGVRCGTDAQQKRMFKKGTAFNFFLTVSDLNHIQ